MKLKLERKYLNSTYTIGKLYVNDEYFCDVIEDAVRQVKIYGKTAIPYGTYDIIMSLSPHFSPIYKRKVPELMKVPGFENIRIHAGNTASDTLGCLIVGENKIKGKVINSLSTMKKLFDVMDIAVANNESIQIEII